MSTAMRYPLTNDQLKQFHGDKARFDVGRESYALFKENPKVVDPKPDQESKQPGAFNAAVRHHIRNFLECVKTRQQPTATVEKVHYSNVALCMAMESLKSGRRIKFNEAARRMERA
ncbi:MAG: hypothetical protein U0R19_34665 [Bryobacteraceae bacterium]